MTHEEKTSMNGSSTRLIDGKTIIMKTDISIKRQAPHDLCNEWVGIYENEEVLVSEWNFKYTLDSQQNTTEPNFQEFLRKLDKIEEHIKRFPTLTGLDQTVVVPYLFCTVERTSVNPSSMNIYVIIGQKIKESEQSLSNIINTIKHEPNLCRHLAGHAVCALRSLHEKNLFHGALSSNNFWFSDTTFRLSDAGTLAYLLTLADVFKKCIDGNQIQLTGDNRYTRKKDLEDLGSMFDGIQLDQENSTSSDDFVKFITVCQKAEIVEELFNLSYLKVAGSDRFGTFGLDENSRLLNDFISIKPLGRGAFGVVLLAKNKIDFVNYAIKMIYWDSNDEERNRKIRREARLLAELSHPNVVRYYNTWIESESKLLFIQMEFCGHVTLRSFIDKNSLKQDSKTIWRMFKEILSGLSYLHKEGLIHRDIKPMNVLLDGKNHIKIVDFGLATRDILLLGCVSEQSMGIGTMLYMAPEMLDINRTTPYCSKIDIYSLGVILFEMFYKPICSTIYEWTKSLGSLRRSIEFPTNFGEGYTNENVDLARNIITRMVQQKAEDRPTADELLKNENSQKIIQNTNHNITKIDRNLQKAIQILVIGGYGYYGEDIILLDYNEKTWKDVSIKLPNKVKGHGTVVLDDELYIIGGFNDGSQTYCDTVYRLNIQMEWKPLAHMHEKSAGIDNSCISHNGCIWVIGGRSGHRTFLNTVEKYDKATNRWEIKPKMRRPRVHATAAVINNKIYVCGGYIEGALLNSVEVFDIISEVWTDFCTMPEPRDKMSIIVEGTNIILIGGNEIFKNKKTMWKIDVEKANKKWSNLQPLNEGRKDFSAVRIESREKKGESGYILAFGGSKINRDRDTSSTVEEFDGQKWKPFIPLPEPRCMHTSVVLTPAMIDAFRPYVLEI